MTDSRGSSASPTSSIEFALRPPDAGQRALDERVMAMTSDERAFIAARLRRKAFVVVNQVADEAGPMSELERAEFILRRLYPELAEAQLRHVLAELAKAESAGGWHGFTRPG